MISETSKARERLIKYCQGNGLDLGYGGDPIIPSSITVDIQDPWLGTAPRNLKGDACNLYWFRDGVLDYVYASHLLEDFWNTEEILMEWLRVIRMGGFLVLTGPDQMAYRRYCERVGSPPNWGHRVDSFGLAYLKKVLKDLKRRPFYIPLKIVHEIALIDDYCFDLVVQKGEI